MSSDDARQPVDPDPRREPKGQRLASSAKTSVFVIGFALIVFTAIRNSLTWQVQRMWGASGSFWQDIWLKIHSRFQGHQFALHMLMFWLAPLLLFYAHSLLLLALDVWGPRWVKRYKIQPGQNDPLDRPKTMRVFKLVGLNQFIVGPLVSVGFYHLATRRGGLDYGPNLPTFGQVLLEAIVFLVCEEIGFYYSHRLFHHKALYKHIHKIHHEWTAPIGLAAIYAHPLEHVLANLAPVLTGPYLMGAHATTTALWMLMVVLNTVNTHSNYHFPGFPSPEAHDFHHLKFNYCFGVLGILDRLHGTDSLFRQSRHFERHVTFFSLQPIREQIPDRKARRPESPSCSVEQPPSGKNE